jgi:hypothetical protein
MNAADQVSEDLGSLVSLYFLTNSTATGGLL